MFALAQHFGVPTRLLDWSWRSTTAAYFAGVEVARGIVERKEVPERIAIWAMSSSFMQRFRNRDIFIATVTAPAVSNRNLHAQAGLFTLVGFSDEPQHDDEFMPTLDSIVFNTPVEHVACDRQAHRAPALIKYTLPASEAGVLLRYLAIDGVSGATIYPDASGAARAVNERAWHCSRPRPQRR